MGKGGGASGARGGGGGGGGAKASSPAKGSAQDPVTAGQLDKMTVGERTNAFRAMPTGTIVSKRTIATDTPTRYQKDSSGSWNMEIVYNTVNSKGRLVEKREWKTGFGLASSSSDLAKFAYSSGSYASVKYPKK